MAFATKGTTVSFGSNVEELTDISFSEDGKEIEVTNLASTTAEYETGIKDVELSLTVNGHSAITVGSTGAATVTWTNGAASTIATSICTKKEVSGELTNKITTKLTFKPYGGA